MSPASSSDQRQQKHELELRRQFHRRIILAATARQLTQAAIARGLNAAESTISDIFNPDVMAMPEGIKMVQLPSVMGVNGHWLLTGEGPMFDVVPDPTGRVQYAAGAEAVIARLSHFLGDLRREMDLQGARAKASLAVADEAKLAGASPQRRKRRSGGHSR